MMSDGRERMVDNNRISQAALLRFPLLCHPFGVQISPRGAGISLRSMPCLRRGWGQVPVTRRCLKPGEDFSPDEFIGAVADELRDALEGLVER